MRETTDVIAILDYGMGNLRSIANMLRKAGIEATMCADRDTLARSDSVVLPGVGAFDTGMARLDASGLRPALEEHAILQKKPVLGICLGMQLLGRCSEEGTVPGLGWIDATTVKIQQYGGLKIPHMGWGDVIPTRSSGLFPDQDTVARFYFVHSYVVRCNNAEDVLGTGRYGGDFACAVGRGNLFGVQFHPEKSHHFGVQLLRNFAAIG